MVGDNVVLTASVGSWLGESVASVLVGALVLGDDVGLHVILILQQYL